MVDGKDDNYYTSKVVNADDACLHRLPRHWPSQWYIRETERTEKGVKKSQERGAIGLDGYPSGTPVPKTLGCGIVDVVQIRQLCGEDMARRGYIVPRPSADLELSVVDSSGWGTREV